MATTSLPFSSANGAIRIQNIYALLGLRGSATLGRDLAWANSNAHGRTNKWARYKPEAIGTPAPITDAMRRANNYGLVPSDPATLSGLPLNGTNIQRIASLTWSYAAPSPGEHWARLTDWDGYEHEAIPPMTPPGEVTVLFGDTTATFMLLNNAIRTDANLSINDFTFDGTAVNDLYLCVVIFRVHKTTGAYDILIRQTATNTIGNGGREIEVNITSLRSLANPTQYDGLKYLLCLTNQPVSAGNNKSASPYLRPLVTDTPPIADLSIATDSPFRVTVTGVAARNTSPAKFLTISRFYGPIAIGEGADHFGIKEGLWISVVVKNETSASRVLSDSTIRLTTTHNLVTHEGNTDMVETAFGGGMYLINGNEYSPKTSITIPAGGEVSLILDASQLPMKSSAGYVVTSSVRDHTTMSATFRHITDSSSFDAPAGTLNIRIHNGSGTKSF